MIISPLIHGELHLRSSYMEDDTTYVPLASLVEMLNLYAKHHTH